VLGTVAVRDPDLVRGLAADHPGRVVVGIDARQGMVAVEGWAEATEMPVHELALAFEDAGVAAIVYTDIERDGVLGGPNVAAAAALARAVSTPVVASGGVAGAADIAALRDAGAGIAGVIVGRALYDGRIAPAEALAVAEESTPC
jgi:phosphoribosylformimino-5-aminoimidazole carboxamide ribotide isomerase